MERLPLSLSLVFFLSFNKNLGARLSFRTGNTAMKKVGYDYDFSTADFLFRESNEQTEYLKER